MRLLCLIVAVLVVCATARAEDSNRPAEATPQNGLKKRFDAADRNNDGFVGVREAKAAAERPGARRRLRQAGKDGDRRISEDESIAHRRRLARRAEAQRRFEMLKAQYGKRNLTRADWLAKRPKVAERLVENDQFVHEHPGVLAALAGHDTFVKNHPKLADRIAKRRQWLKNHPRAASEPRRGERFSENHPNAARRIDRRRDFVKHHPNAAKRIDRRRDFVKDHPNAAKRIDRRQSFVKAHPIAAGKVAAHRNQTTGKPDLARRAVDLRRDVRKCQAKASCRAGIAKRQSQGRTATASARR